MELCFPKEARIELGPGSVKNQILRINCFQDPLATRENENLALNKSESQEIKIKEIISNNYWHHLFLPKRLLVSAEKKMYN